MATSRPLTAGEIALAKQVFKGSLDYAKVKVHNDTYIFFQPETVWMTPNGEIYCGKKVYTADFSAESKNYHAYFIHEMTHVWQYQMGMSVRSMAVGEMIENLGDYDEAYNYTLASSKDLLDYGLEQQAQIVEDYYRLQIAKTGRTSSRLKNKIPQSKQLPAYKAVLSKFLSNPSYAKPKKADPLGDIKRQWDQFHRMAPQQQYNILRRMFGDTSPF